MEKRLSEQLKVMEEMGVDTNGFTIYFGGKFFAGNKELAPVTETVFLNTPIEDKQLNHDSFRRWITAQTFRMLDYKDCRNEEEKGWDAYLRKYYSYNYQFKMMVEELKRMEKIKLTDKDEFETRLYFFNKNVVVKTCKHYVRMVEKKYAKCTSSGDELDKIIKVKGIGKTTGRDLNNLDAKLTRIIYDIQELEDDDVSGIRVMLNKFIRNMKVKLADDTPKCNAWKEAFKGSGAYYTLKNLILFHDVKIYTDDYSVVLEKREALRYLDDKLKEYHEEYEEGNSVWKLHYLMKKTIKDNNFSLEEFKDKYAKKIESNF